MGPHTGSNTSPMGPTQGSLPRPSKTLTPAWGAGSRSMAYFSAAGQAGPAARLNHMHGHFVTALERPAQEGAGCAAIKFGADR